MSLGQGLASLIAVVALALVAIEVARELRGPEWLREQPWWAFVSGALAATVILLLAATFALLRTAS